GAHDENIPFERVVALLGAPLAEAVRASALALYGFAAEHARRRGILIADTKFEFGVDEKGTLTLIDEVLTPDSSRVWPADTYRAGRYLPGRREPAELRQAVRPRLPRDAHLGQARPGTEAAARGDRAHQRQVPRGARAPHGRVRRIG